MISVKGDDRLRAVALMMRQIAQPVKREIDKRTRTTLNPVWRQLVDEKLERPRDRAVLGKGVRVKAGNPPALVAASSRRPLGGGLIPAYQWSGIEFGANRDEVETYSRRSSKGGSHKVTRHTARQMPPRYRKGRIIYPAFAAFAPRAVSLWVQTVVRTIMDAYEEAAR